MTRLPRWLKRRIPKGNADHYTRRLLDSLDLATVCDHAKCPNRMECYARRTATFLLLGPVCTRNCRFCSVQSGTPAPVDESEPGRVAEAVRTLELRHVVLTCVSRDDLPDGGAEHFCRTIEAIRSLDGETLLEPADISRGNMEADQRIRGLHEGEATHARTTGPHPYRRYPGIEVLPSDFAGNGASVDRLADALPDVYNYNTETVPRLFRTIRGPIPDFRWTLEIFRRVRRRRPSIRLKSGLMLGLGETDDEVIEVLHRLREAGCDGITLGQYLQPAPDRLPVDRYVTPEEFERLGETARAIGFTSVASAPFVRSSYRAGESELISPT